MTNKKKTGQTVPIETFAEAFCKLLKCTPDEIEIEMIEVNQCACVTHRMTRYEVTTREYLLDDVIRMLTCPEAAQSMPVFIWLEAAMASLSRGQFYTNLVEALVEEKQFVVFHLALSISSFAPNKEEIFWHTLFDLDKESNVFGQAMWPLLKPMTLNRWPMISSPFKSSMQIIYIHLQRATFLNWYMLSSRTISYSNYLFTK